MKHTNKRLALTAASLAALMLALLLAACAPATDPSAEASQGGGQAAAPVATNATVIPLYPIEGDEVEAGTVAVQVDVADLALSMPSNTNVDGEGHIHFTLDDRPFEMSVEPGITFDDVEPGTHTLKIELVQNDTKPFEPAVVQEITFTAK